MFNLAFQQSSIFIFLSILTVSTAGKFAVSRRVMQRIFQIETDVNTCLTHIQSMFSTSKSSTGFFMSSDCTASSSSSSELSRARLHWLSWSWSRNRKNNVMCSHQNSSLWGTSPRNFADLLCICDNLFPYITKAPDSALTSLCLTSAQWYLAHPKLQGGGKLKSDLKARFNFNVLFPPASGFQKAEK